MCDQIEGGVIPVTVRRAETLTDMTGDVNHPLVGKGLRMDRMQLGRFRGGLPPDRSGLQIVRDLAYGNRFHFVPINLVEATINRQHLSLPGVQ